MFEGPPLLRSSRFKVEKAWVWRSSDTTWPVRGSEIAISDCLIDSLYLSDVFFLRPGETDVGFLWL